MSLPLLDLRLWSTHPTLFASQLRSACHKIGFFLLRHDLPSPHCERILAETRGFFREPRERKMTISYESEPSLRGYMHLGVENTAGRLDVREQVEFAVEYPNWRSTRRSGSSKLGSGGGESTEECYYDRLRAPSNPWPDKVRPSLRPATVEYVGGLLGVARRLREAMCLGLNVDSDAVAELFGDVDEDEMRSCRGGSGEEDENGEASSTIDGNADVPHWALKLVSYPPMDANGDDDERTSLQGVGAHTDTNFLTLILQDPSVGGLQVHSDGGWIDVPPTDSQYLVCNLGELAEIWTAGYFLATPHRVVRNRSDNRCRTSVPLFYNPCLSAKVGPMVNVEGLPWERPERNQWKRERNAMLGSVGENTFKSLARSHPKVFGNLHGDLQVLDDGRIVGRR